MIAYRPFGRLAQGQTAGEQPPNLTPGTFHEPQRWEEFPPQTATWAALSRHPRLSNLIHQVKGMSMRIKSTLARAIAGTVAALAVGGVLAIAAGSAAQAKDEYKYWNSSTNPLTVTGYGSTAKAYGQWRVADGADGTKAFLDSRMWLQNADNHKKYTYNETWTSTGYCIEPQYTSCSAQFYFYASSETSHSNTGDWQWLYTSTYVPSSGNSARGSEWACLDIPLRSDPCNGATKTLPTNY